MANILRHSCHDFCRILPCMLRFGFQESAFTKAAHPRQSQVLLPSKNIRIRSQSTRVSALTEGEKRIAEKIKSNLNVSRVEVEDISGGCGSMYRIFVASDEFVGKRTIQQHRIINNILKDEVKDMHGLTLETAVS